CDFKALINPNTSLWVYILFGVWLESFSFWFDNKIVVQICEHIFIKLLKKSKTVVRTKKTSGCLTIFVANLRLCYLDNFLGLFPYIFTISSLLTLPLYF
ncbi:hypothetical protein L9F63_020412, partial [Diploptera punctata]